MLGQQLDLDVRLHIVPQSIHLVISIMKVSTCENTEKSILMFNRVSQTGYAKKIKILSTILSQYFLAEYFIFHFVAAYQDILRYLGMLC